MNNMARSYIKPNPEVEVADINVKSVINSPSASSNQMRLELHSSYTKPDASLYAKAYIVIFSGGTTREKDYFKLLSNEFLFPRFKFDFFSEPNFDAEDEPRIFEYSYQKVNLYKSSETNECPDSYYIISDVDHFYKHLVTNYEKCQQLGIKLIISNPCFEVWLYYSKYKDKFIGFTQPTDILQLSKSIKQWYNKDGKIQTKTAILDIEKNIENAIINYKENCDNLPDTFSTNMHIFASEILPYIKKEIAQIIENNKKARESHINH